MYHSCASWHIGQDTFQNGIKQLLVRSTVKSFDYYNFCHLLDRDLSHCFVYLLIQVAFEVMFRQEQNHDQTNRTHFVWLCSLGLNFQGHTGTLETYIRTNNRQLNLLIL